LQTTADIAWPQQAIFELLDVKLPILQAPMAGANGVAMAAAVTAAGGLGALPCAMLTAEQTREQIITFRQQTDGPVNLNFFCHQLPEPDPARDAGWRAQFQTFYEEWQIPLDSVAAAPARQPFDDAMCEVVEEYTPALVSFHFGLPGAELLARVKQAGSRVVSSATTVAEARWLEQQGCDAIIAQGIEAGGHRGMFLTDDLSTQLGTMALLPQVVDAVAVPVIAAGGIVDARSMVAALALGASAVQLGTYYLMTPQSTISDLHRQALRDAETNYTALTNVFSGRPARGLMNHVMREVGPMSDKASHFPTAGAPLAPLKAKAEAAGRADFSSLWSGQNNHALAEVDAGELTTRLAAQAQVLLASLQASDAD